MDTDEKSAGDLDILLKNVWKYEFEEHVNCRGINDTSTMGYPY